MCSKRMCVCVSFCVLKRMRAFVCVFGEDACVCASFCVLKRMRACVSVFGGGASCLL